MPWCEHGRDPSAGPVLETVTQETGAEDLWIKDLG